MNAFEIAMFIWFLLLADAWLFWYAAKSERKRFEQERMRHKGRRHLTYTSPKSDSKRRTS